MRMNHRGLALILVVGVLGLLAVLGAAFATMAQLERRASRQRLYATKAMLLARSGLEDALARLGAGQDPEAPANRYGGEDWVPNGKLSALEAAEQVFRVTPAGTAADVETCPVQHAMRPSFAAMIPGSLNAVTHRLDGRLRGYSGRLSDDLATAGNAYALKVESGGIHLNGGDPARPPAEGYNGVLRRILGTLAEAIDREDGILGDGPVAQADGLNLVDLRPGTGWQGLEQVRDLALGGSQAKLDALGPYLALSAWVDRKVIRPNAVPEMEGQDYTSWADFKLAHETYPGVKEPDFERIPLLPTGGIVGRAPVDLGWARTRRPALVALLAGLKGLYLDESTAQTLAGYTGVPDAMGTIRSAEIALDWAPGSDLMAAVDGILDSTDGLGTWEQWNALCDGLAMSGTSDLAQAKRDLLKANFNPNSDLNKFNPNPSLWRRVDKSDLLAYSTEFDLLGAANPQRLACAGSVLDRDGRLLARRVLRTSIAPRSRVTISTQKEFVCDDLGDPDVAGDETGFRIPGTQGVPFISRSQGTGKTWGHALGQPGLGSRGASLQSYPEPCVDAGGGLSIRPADYDGSVQLATVETPDDERYDVTATTQDMKLLARYTADLDLDVSDAAPARPPGDLRWRNQPDVRQVTFNDAEPAHPLPSQLANGLLDATRPNTLYPDGVYSEKDRAPSYLDRDNANGLQGLISFWGKSGHDVKAAPWPRGHPFFKWTHFTVGNPVLDSQDQFFFLGEGLGGWVTCQFEINHDTDDDEREHCFKVARILRPHAWALITLSFDLRSAEHARRGRGTLRVDAGILGTEDLEEKDSYEDESSPPPAVDFTMPDLFGDHRLSLGGGRPLLESGMEMYTGSGADVTFDELAVYDLGGAGEGGIPAADLPTLASPGILALTRFREGRYYRESEYPASGGMGVAPGLLRNAGEYVSPLIRLEGPSRITALAWTQIVPAGLRAPLDAGPDGEVILELLGENPEVPGAEYLRDIGGIPIARTFSSPAFSRVDRIVSVPFRLHAVFKPNLAEKDNTPVLDPLALDDVTVVYEPAGGRRILSFSDSDAGP